MENKQENKDYCPFCHECTRVIRAWSTQWRSGGKIVPVRRRALAWCENELCPSRAEKKKAA
jgi:hypothetical protein